MASPPAVGIPSAIPLTSVPSAPREASLERRTDENKIHLQSLHSKVTMQIYRQTKILYVVNGGFIEL